MGVGMQEQAELSRATESAHGVAKIEGTAAVAVIGVGLAMKVLQKETALWYCSVGLVARRARRQLLVVGR